ncbi:hypothetical protein OZX57_04965 [Bifidobacterium sp. ESL0682]|uniref:hypothetical protein n=1 Tax=Bifidobacterium sp. ESL0682 TaxID=2983212 RepID=UPI0023F92939|nr:hypothetical protein [Bifidobacterium sp. ESL0682]WEV41406.1 hypothetical protein OZX57_04965 [Bifidobacterium sp. ESL0682]
MNESQNPFDSPEPNGNVFPSNDSQPAGQDSSQTPRNDVDATSGNGNTGAVAESQSQPAVAQPEYGQVKVPEFGAMASQFSSNYNPYVYGKPEPPRQNGNGDQPRQGSNVQGNGQQQGAQFGNHGNGMGQYQGNQGNPNNQGNMPYGGYGQMSGNGYGNNQNYPYGQPYNNGQNVLGGPGAPGYQPDIRNGIDMNDPVQNPLKGHWDPMAIVSIILLFLPITFLPVITGAVSMWRTKKYHMKGFWVATVCMVLGVIATLFELWLVSKGIDMNSLMQQMMGQYGSDGSGSSGSGDQFSA